MESEKDLSSLLDENLQKELFLYKERDVLLKKALHSDDPNAIIKAEKVLSYVEKRDRTDAKSIFVDPLTLSTGLGFKDKRLEVSYALLRAMSRTHIPKAIIGTRVEQIAEFCEPQPDKYSAGFVIRPKKKVYFQEDYPTPSKDQIREISFLTDFIIECGTKKNSWHGDDFDSFTRKVIPDSLSFDQLNFEIIRDRRGRPVEYLAVDGATMRLAISQNLEDSKNGITYVNQMTSGDMISGYYPSYVQIYNQKVITEFYPWEMCFGIRNPQTDIYAMGYGRSELEDLISTVTNLLNADAYNANYFKVGSNPKGILRVSGNINESRIQELKNQWAAQMAGVKNAHKMLIMESDKMDFISTQSSNKDMEYNKYYEFLIKLTCAIYKIDPSEIAFPMQGSADAKPMFEGNNEARLKYSKDKGLKPLLKFYQRKIQKMIIEPWNDFLNGDYEFVFCGLEAETAEQELEALVKKVQNFKTVNEARKELGLKSLGKKGDIILNPIYFQQIQMEAMGGEESNEFIDNEQGEDQNPFEQTEESQNPFEKSINKEFSQLFQG